MNNMSEVPHCFVGMRELTEAVLAELTSFERSCLLLLVDDGFTLEEIAQILDKSLESVKLALRRAYSHFHVIHKSLYGKSPSVGELHQGHPADQQNENDFIETCIKTLRGPEQPIELPSPVRQQWEILDCIDNVQATVAGDPPFVPASSISDVQAQDSSSKEDQIVQEQSVIPMGVDTEEEISLQQMDSYIRKLVQRKVQMNSISAEIADLEFDELAQQVRIKLWLALQKNSITNLRAYIRCIVHNEWIGFLRRKKKYRERIVTEDEELWLGSLSLSSDDYDPAVEIEQKETEMELLEKIVGVIQTLPSSQRTALICFLRERVDDPVALNKAFQEAKNTDILNVRWPEDRETRQRLGVSCNFARFRLAQRLGIDLNCYIKRR